MNEFTELGENKSDREVYVCVFCSLVVRELEAQQRYKMSSSFFSAVRALVHWVC